MMVIVTSNFTQKVTWLSEGKNNCFLPLVILEWLPSSGKYTPGVIVNIHCECFRYLFYYTNGRWVFEMDIWRIYGPKLPLLTLKTAKVEILNK